MRQWALVSAAVVASFGVSVGSARAADPLQPGSLLTGGAMIRFGQFSEPGTICVTERNGDTFRGFLSRSDLPKALYRTVEGTVKDGKVEFTETETHPDLVGRPARKYAGNVSGDAVKGMSAMADPIKRNPPQFFSPNDDFEFKAAGRAAEADLKQRTATYDAALAKAKGEYATIERRLAAPDLAKYKFELVGPSLDGTYSVDFRKFKTRSDDVKRADLEALRPLKHLGLVLLDFAQLSDEDLQPLGGLESIRELSFYQVPITGKGLTHLKKLPPIDQIQFYASGLNDEGLKAVGQLAGVRKLMMTNTAVSDRGLSALAGLKGLRELQLGGSFGPLTADAIAALPPLPELETLAFLGFQTSETSLRALKQFPALTQVQLNEVAAADLKVFAEIPNLVGITCLVFKGMSDEHLLPLVNMPNLKWFNPGGAYWVPRGDFIDYIRRLPKQTREQSASYQLVRLLQAISQTDADAAAFRRRALLYFPKDTWEANRKYLGDFLNVLDNDRVDLQGMVSNAGGAALILASKGFEGDDKRAVAVWANVYLYTGKVHPRLQKNLTEKEWADLQASHRAYRKQSGEIP